MKNTALIHHFVDGTLAAAGPFAAVEGQICDRDALRNKSDHCTSLLPQMIFSRLAQQAHMRPALGRFTARPSTFAGNAQ